MVQLISKTKAEGYLVNYYDMLTKTGYVKDSMLKKLLLYIFLIDFVDELHFLITEKDYGFIDKALSRIFVNGGCLLPYPVFCTRRATLGSAGYMGDFVVRVTEDLNGNDKRITEQEDIRIY